MQLWEISFLWRWGLCSCRVRREGIPVSGDKTYDDLQKNEQLAFAVVRALEIIGEAAAQTTQEFRDAYPNIQWRNIISMRNKLVHAYFDINYKIVWSAVKEDIPQLLQQLKAVKD